jgi:DNA-binding LacI/PurR family transcriptional regulator
MKKEKSRITSYNVAKLAGVSRSAVSRAFTPNASVSLKTREKVNKAAKKLGYHPNVIARSLITKKTQLIGLLMADWENPFYASALKKYSEKLQKENYQTVLATINENSDINTSIEFLMQYQVDGIIMLSALPSEDLVRKCNQKHTPIVLVGNSSKEINTCTVNIDHNAIGENLADLALNLGYRRFVMIRGDKNIESGIQRTDSFSKVIEEKEEGKILANFTGILGHDEGRNAMADIIKIDPELVICSSDLTALGIIDGARIDYNLEIPRDMAVIGFGDNPISSWGMNRLTTVQLPYEKLIDESIRCLIRRINNPELPPKNIELLSDIITRDTTRKLMQ